MSSKRKSSRATANTPWETGSAGHPAEPDRGASKSASARPPASRRPWALLGSGLVVALIAVVVGWTVSSNQPGTGSPAATGDTQGIVVQAYGGHWTNITPDTLASMLEKKDFTLLNVKTPYTGEIAGTDLYIPYTDLAAHAGQLPADKAAKIVVYCRSGNQSAIAAQTLIDLGYTNVDNLDGGMTAWTASGRQIVLLNRT